MSQIMSQTLLIYIYNKCKRLTVYYKVIGDPLWAFLRWMPDQTVQLLPVHVTERVERKLDGGHLPIWATVLTLTREIGVPGQACHRLSHRTAYSSRTEWLALNQCERLQGRNGFSCEMKWQIHDKWQIKTW